MRMPVVPADLTPEHGPWTWMTPDRWYRAWIAQDLWGQWELHQAWGSRHNGLGRYRTLPMTDRVAALQQARAIARMRLRHAYVRIA